MNNEPVFHLSREQRALNDPNTSIGSTLPPSILSPNLFYVCAPPYCFQVEKTLYFYQFSTKSAQKTTLCQEKNCSKQIIIMALRIKVTGDMRVKS